MNVTISRAIQVTRNHQIREEKSEYRPQDRAPLTRNPCTDHGTTHHSEQWNPVNQICGSPDSSRCNGNFDFVTNPTGDRVVEAIGFGASTKHLCQLLTTAPSFFMATSASLLGNFDDGLVAIECTHDGAYSGYFMSLHRQDYQRLSGLISSRGRNFAATASRARKIRERTVPIGQFITWAISS